MKTVALRRDSFIVSWVKYPLGPGPDDNDFNAIAAGGTSSLGVKRNGTIVGWDWYYGFEEPTPVIAVIVEKYSYEAYGEPNGISWVGNAYRYTGREYEPETGLYYYRARFYNPWIGRFLQTDPIGYEGGINLYTYVGNNPLNFVDPLGLYTMDWSWWWSFREEERARILASFARVRGRCDQLVEQIDRELKATRSGPLHRQLMQLRGTIVSVRNGIDSDRHINIYNQKWNQQESDAKCKRMFWPYDPRLYYNKNTWTGLSDEDLDASTLHELSHFYGAEDEGDWVHNAHSIDDLMNIDLAKDVDYRWEKRKEKRNSEKSCGR